MKAIATSLFIMLALLSAKANDPYRVFLLQKISAAPVKPAAADTITLVPPVNCTIPHYEIPKGHVFCRMEDKLSRKAKLWIKVGVK
jgi:hypothetical protein